MANKNKPDSVEIFTDGACSGNPGPGGWGVLLRFGSHVKTLSGAEKVTTNNRMELQAAIEGLSALKKPCVVDLTTDSTYVRNGITDWINSWQKNNWKTSNKKPVKNKDLWMKLLEIISQHQVKWHWVKGHSGHPDNELVDTLAKEAIETISNESKGR